jgi:aminopeptidase-like protein
VSNTDWDLAPLDRAGDRMFALAQEMFPLNRSLTGDGVRRTLDAVGQVVPLVRCEVPSGDEVFDWTVPPEWNVTEAYVVGPDGERVVDFADSNLHLVGYSQPVRDRLSLAELRPHLHSLPAQPDRIPYRTSYHDRAWGFCLRHSDLERLPEGEYEVVVDATLAPEGFLSYGELHLPGETGWEVLISAHVCHPSLANDNISGIVVAAELARFLRSVPHRHGYRFVFAPATVGALAWLAANGTVVPRILGGLVLACVGDGAELTYKRSRRGDGIIDRAAAYVVAAGGGADRPFSPTGGDERQYCSPGFDLAVGTLMRSPFGEFDGYHTSADDLDLIHTDALEGTLLACVAALRIVETDGRYRNLRPMGEPQLGKRGLYPSAGSLGAAEALEAMQWNLSFGDGESSLLDIAERSGLPYESILRAARVLTAAGLLEQVDAGAGDG